MSFEDEEDEEENNITTIYLWWEHFTILDIYQIARSYVINEYYILDSTVLLALIKDKKVNISNTLEAISNIHYGYTSIILTSSKDNG